MDDVHTARAGTTRSTSPPALGPVTAPEPVDFSLFYARHLSRLVRHLMRLGAEPHEAAEAAQSAFTEAYALWPRLTHPGAWLRTVAYRHFLRREARCRELTDTPPETLSPSCPLRAVEIKEEELRVYEALASLPPQPRRVMAWHLDGYGTAEIAHALDMKPDAVRQNLGRARARLKAVLGLTQGGAQK
ncbi:RNA polymerase sigma factor [Streptomyces silvensis]|uniref:RNA polymerase sigma factor n=1 Tax=Streptomyces silvensis TaxID=1765722 RepID=UPI000A4EB8F1|nr:sigma-70 family RNA polymerase sigma factor [Streptomyces silvensis]